MRLNFLTFNPIDRDWPCALKSCALDDGLKACAAFFATGRHKQIFIVPLKLLSNTPIELHRGLCGSGGLMSRESRIPSPLWGEGNPVRINTQLILHFLIHRFV